MKIRKNQAGFSAFELTILVFVVAIIGFAGYWVYSQNQTTPSSSPQTTAPADSSKATNVSEAPQINTKSDLTKAEKVIDQNDPASANSSDSKQLDSMLSAF